MRLCINKSRNIKYIVIPFLLIILSFFIIKRLEPAFWSNVEEYAVKNVNNSINQAVSDVLEQENISYNDIVTLRTTEENDITAVEFNSVKMNILRTHISKSIDKSISDYKNNELNLKFGTIFGTPLLAGMGPDIKIKISPTSQTIIDFRDSLNEGGINQVKHSIHMLVSVNINITTATIAKSKQINLTIPVADTIIIGKVPRYYGLNNGAFIGAENNGTD